MHVSSLIAKESLSRWYAGTIRAWITWTDHCQNVHYHCNAYFSWINLFWWYPDYVSKV